jgi:hypothetical protein
MLRVFKEAVSKVQDKVSKHGAGGSGFADLLIDCSFLHESPEEERRRLRKAF